MKRRQPVLGPVVRVLEHEYGLKPLQAHALLGVVGAAWAEQLMTTGACRVPGLVTVRIDRLPARSRRDPRDQRVVAVPASSALKLKVARKIWQYVYGSADDRRGDI